METKEIVIGGIERHSDPQGAPAGVCEELINVRTDLMGLHLYRQGEAISSDLSYDNIFIHRFGGREFYLGVDPSSNVVRFTLNGRTQQTLQWVSSSGNTDIKSIGNMLIVSDKGGADGRLSTSTYVYDSDKDSYVRLDADKLPLPIIDRMNTSVRPLSSLGYQYRSNITILPAVPERGVAERHVFNFFHYVQEGMTYGVEFKESVKQTLQGALGRVCALDKHIAHGYVLIGTTITLYDGTETAFSNLQVVDLSSPTPFRDAGVPDTFSVICDKNENLLYIHPEENSLDGIFFQNLQYDNDKIYFGLQVDGGDLFGSTRKSSYFHSLTPKVSVSRDIANYKDYVRSINLYVSKPIDKIDWERFDVRIYRNSQVENIEVEIDSSATMREVLTSNNRKNIVYPKAPIRHLNQMKEQLHSQLLFKQKEWSVQELIENDFAVTYECEFGTSEGTLGDTLQVDAWNTKRAGTMFIYNNRVHMFDSVCRVDVPDSDLVCLNGFDNLWYDSLPYNASADEGGRVVYFRLADSYSERDKMVEASVSDILDWSGKERGILGVFVSGGEAAPTDPDIYTWYHLSWTNTRYKSIRLISHTSGGSQESYIFLSHDKTSTTLDSSARYIAFSPVQSGVSPSELSWYPAASEDYSWAEQRKTRLCSVIAYLKQDTKTLVIRHERVPILFRYITDSEQGVVGELTNIAELSGMLTYPDSRCIRLVIQYSASGQTYSWETTMTSEESSYNFAYTYLSSEEVLFAVGSPNTDQTSNIYTTEDTLSVSALNNPTVFPVANSYRFKGAITGLALALEELNTTQTGSYPVYVMTEVGVFALQQGRDVLYSNINPISTDNCVKGKYVQVKQGVVYLANNRLYYMVGRQRVDILLPLDGDPDKRPRQNNAYKLACCNNRLYNIEPYLCQDNLLTFLQDIQLCFDSYHNELIMSNKNYNFSFVFGFDAKRWYKISGCYDSLNDGLIIAQRQHSGQDQAQPAQGAMSIDLLAIEQGQRINYNYVATLQHPVPYNYKASKGDKITLSHNKKTIASITLSAEATLPAMLSLLTKNLNWIETDPLTTPDNTQVNCCMYINTTAMDTSQSVILTNANSREQIFFPVRQYNGVITTQNKLIGQTLSLQLNNNTIASKNITENDTINAITTWITHNINDKTELIATKNKNNITITAPNNSTTYNNYILSLLIPDNNSGWIKQEMFLSYSTTPLNGARQTTPINQPVKLKKLSDEQHHNTTFHIQTRPIQLKPLHFSTINRTLLRLNAQLQQQDNISLYIFASNNLYDYKCVAAQQRENCTIDRIRLEKIAHAYKYFIFIIGGKTNTKTTINTIISQFNNNAEKHIK